MMQQSLPGDALAMRKYNGLERVHRALGLTAALVLAGCAGETPKASAPPATDAFDAAPAAPLAAPATPPATASVAVPAELPPAVALRSDTPLRYVVRRGDTLWDIANHFLKEPWQWPEIWYVNDQVRNPHRIYPGDVLTLVWRDGRPQLLAAEGLNANLEYLSPRVRELPLEAAVPAVPLEAIRDFLRSPRLLDAEALRQAPYLLSFVDPHVIEGAGSLVYVQNLPAQPLPRYEAVRLGKKFTDPDSGELLGWEGTPVGGVELRKPGRPGTALISSSTREAKAGDRLIPPLDETLASAFYPHAPAAKVGARILSVFDGVSQIGQYQVVTINRGARDGIEPGHVLSILQANRRARDPYSKRLVSLPPLYAGTMLVFKTEARVSYALVMKAVREIHVLDVAEQPQPGEQP